MFGILVIRSGWASGNSMAFIIEGSGRRDAESYEGNTPAAPLLVIEYVPDSFYVAPGDSQLVEVIFSPTSTGLFNDTLLILNDDTNQTVCFTGEAYPAPVISTDPGSLDVTITGCCDSSIHSFTIFNTGGSDLSVELLSGEGSPTFFDGFESGNLNAWVDQGGPYTKQVTTTAPAVGSYCLELTGDPQNSLQTGVSSTFSSSTNAET